MSYKPSVGGARDVEYTIELPVKYAGDGGTGYACRDFEHKLLLMKIVSDVSLKSAPEKILEGDVGGDIVCRKVDVKVYTKMSERKMFDKLAAAYTDMIDEFYDTVGMIEERPALLYIRGKALEK